MQGSISVCRGKICTARVNFCAVGRSVARRVGRRLARRVVKALACWHHMKWEVRERTRQTGAQPACGASEGPSRGGAGAAREGEQAGASGATDERADDEQDEDGDTKSSRRGQRIRKLDDAKTGIENKRRKTSATTRRWTRLDILQAGAAIMDDVDAEWRGWRG